MVIKNRLFIFIFVMLVFFPMISSQEYNHVISNSEDWEDVYSVVHFSNLKHIDSDFLVTTKHGSLLMNGLSKSQNYLIVSSNDQPYVINYADDLKAKGFDKVEEMFVDNANRELIDLLPDVKNFIIVGDNYGYNSIAVAPYAVITDSWVFLANGGNIYQIDSILKDRKIDNIVVYGYVDREVRDVLDKYNPEVIDEGDRFANNIAIVKKYIERTNAKQVILTNGEFIESQIMKGKDPVLFTGKENVPDQIKDYLKTSDIEVGVLIGNSLIGAATNIRRSTGISVMAKFARSARNPQSTISAVEGLDLFPLPAPTLGLKLYSVKYNKASSELEVTYQSTSNAPLYLKGSISILTSTGTKRVGDSSPVFLAPNDFRTLSYSVNLESSGNLTADISTLFGETVSSMDRILEASVLIDVIDVIDRCEINVEDNWVKYNKQKGQFIIKIENVADVDCWVDVELRDLKIGYETERISSDDSLKISAGDTEKVIIKQELTEEDLKKNKFVNLAVYYGERKDSLIKLFKGKFELVIQTLTVLMYAIIALVLIILLLIIIMFILKRREDDF